jgi:hypothetical protein
MGYNFSEWLFIQLRKHFKSIGNDGHNFKSSKTPGCILFNEALIHISDLFELNDRTSKFSIKLTAHDKSWWKYSNILTYLVFKWAIYFTRITKFWLKMKEGTSNNWSISKWYFRPLKLSGHLLKLDYNFMQNLQATQIFPLLFQSHAKFWNSFGKFSEFCRKFFSYKSHQKRDMLHAKNA